MSLKGWDQIECSGKHPARIVLLFICAIFFFRLLYQVFRHPLRAIRGPVAARFTRLWELSAVCKGDWVGTHIELHRRYGPVVRIAPNRYSIATSEDFKAIYGHGSRFTKSPFYHAFGSPDLEKSDLFSERNTQRHASKRRMVASLYSMTTLLSYEQFVDNCNSELCDKLRSFAAEGRVIDIPQWMQFYAFDVIGEISVGKSFGYMQSECDPRGILGAINESMIYGSRIGLFPELHPWLALMVTTLGMKIPFDSVGDFIQEQIEARRSGKALGGSNDFLAKLIALEDSGKIDRHNLFTTLGANIAAGSDTTAITLSSVIYCLLKNPHALKKVREEIDTFAKEGRISNPVTFQEGQKMPYLQAVIKEALRVHPATGQILARIVPAEGAVLAGHFFPEGTVVGCSPWVTHLDEKVYGERPGEFRPERWLENSSQAVTMETNLFSFGAGSRTCIGRNISLLEMVKVIPQIFRYFDLELCHPSKEWEVDSGWFVKQKFDCRVKLRASE